MKVDEGTCEENDYVVCVVGNDQGYEGFADGLIGKIIPYTDPLYPNGTEWEFYRKLSTKLQSK